MTMTRDLIALCFACGIAGAAVSRMVDKADALMTVWRYRRRTQRELEKARQLKADQERAELRQGVQELIARSDRRQHQRIARVMAAVADGPAPRAQEPFRIELAKDDELWPIARYLMISLRGQDRRRFFPGELSKGMDS